MNDLRARPIDVCMADVMPFQQHYEHRTTWPLAEIINETYFLSMRDQFRAGDSITLCRYDGVDPNHRNVQLTEIATVRVIESGRDKPVVRLAMVGPIMRVEGAPEQPARQYRVEPGKAGKFRLMDGEKQVQEFGSKAEADAALKKLMDA